MAQLSSIHAQKNPQGRIPYDIASLASIACVRRLKAGEMLFAEGDEASYCYQVASGFMKQYATLEDGRRQVSEFHDVGDFFGLADADRHLHTAEAVVDTAIRCYPKESFYRITNSSLELSQFFREELTDKLQWTQERMILLGRFSAGERVAFFILSQSDAVGSTEIVLAMSRQDIADFLGLTVETVCRVLSRLKADGVIHMPTARRLEILDRARLTGQAGGLRCNGPIN